jgi:hypothetical protein
LEPAAQPAAARSRLYRLLAATAGQFALAGVVFYGIARFAFALHYARLGVTPEEVGVDKGQALVQSVYYVLYLAVFVPVFLALFAAIFVVPAWLVSKRVRRRLRWPSGSALGWTFVVAFVCALLGLLPYVAWASAGALLSDQDWFGTGPLASALGGGFNAHRVTVNTTDGRDLSRVRDGVCMLHLGTANGFVVLYDARAHTVHRVPQGSVILTTRPGDDSPCNSR